MAANEISELERAGIAARGQAGPSGGRAPAVRALAPLHAVALRHLPGGELAVAQALAVLGVATLPQPGRFVGDEPRVLWRNPQELLVLSTAAMPSQFLAQALAPTEDALAYAVDLSEGVAGLELAGPALDELLQRLVDASAVPRAAGQGTRARLADIAVFVLRLRHDLAWLIADRSNHAYLADWVSHALAALAPQP